MVTLYTSKPKIASKYRVAHLLANLGLVDLIWGVPPAGGRYCSYLLPKQGGGTFQIRVNQSQVRQEMVRPVQDALFADELEFPSVAKKLQQDSKGMAQPAETNLFCLFCRSVESWALMSVLCFV